MTTDDVLTWPIARLLEAYRAQTLTPLDYLEACLARLETTRSVVNAVAEVYEQSARAAATESGRRWAAGTARRLEGVPFAVKDEAGISGQRVTYGSVLYADHIAEETETFVQRLIDAGAYVHIRTLTPEFSVAFWTHSRLHGVTRNPWNPAYDVGGSSGGSAAALASGITPLATGSDIGGSIRVPASVCGVVGYKPPHGRVPMDGVYALDDWCHYGPLARTVEDCALMQDVISGAHPGDHTSLRERVILGVPQGEVAGLRIGLTHDLGDWPVTAEVRGVMDEAAAALRGAGALVEVVDLVVERDLVRRAGNAHHRALFAADVAAEFTGREDLANPYTLRWLELVTRSEETFAQGRALEVEITRRVDAVLEQVDVLICPAMAVPAFDAGRDYLDEPFRIDGVVYEPFHDVCLAEVFNVAHRCPVLTVPAGRSAEGVPIGVQIVGRTYLDAPVFEVGAALQRIRPWPLVAGEPGG